jgi:hypothetical protein
MATGQALTRAMVLEHVRRRVEALFDTDPVNGWPGKPTLHLVVGSLKSQASYFDVRWRTTPPLCFECTSYCVCYPDDGSRMLHPRLRVDAHAVLTPVDVVDAVREALEDTDQATLFCDVWTMRELLADRAAVVSLTRRLLGLAPATGPARTLLLRALAGSDVWDARPDRWEQCQQSAEKTLEKALATVTDKG